MLFKYQSPCPLAVQQAFAVAFKLLRALVNELRVTEELQFLCRNLLTCGTFGNGTCVKEVVCTLPRGVHGKH